MKRTFTPSFQGLQKDIERYLTSEGKREKNEHGQIVFRGYPAALALMFRAYMEKEAFVPLVAEVRKWNPEWSYSGYLLDLTTALQQNRNWPLLKELWTAVVAKRRTNYNKTRQARKGVPDKVPEELVTKTRDLLLESLQRLHGLARECGCESDFDAFATMAARIERGLKA